MCVLRRVYVNLLRCKTNLRSLHNYKKNELLVSSVGRVELLAPYGSELHAPPLHPQGPAATPLCVSVETYQRVREQMRDEYVRAIEASTWMGGATHRFGHRATVMPGVARQ